MDLTSTPTGIKLSTLPVGAKRSRRALYVGTCVFAIIGLLLLGGFLARFMGQSSTTEQAAQQNNVFTETHENETDTSKSGEDVLRELGLDGTTPKNATPAQNASVQPPPPPAPDPIQAPSVNPFEQWLNRSQAQNQQAIAQQQRLPAAAKDQPPLSPEEQMRLDAYNREYEALHKPLTGTTHTSNAAPSLPPVAQSPVTPTLVSAAGPKTDQDQVVTIKNPDSRRAYIKTGTWIEARLDMTAVTDLPGDLHGRITADVVGQHNGEPVTLIPMGATLIGGYSSRLAYGQDRLMQAWTRIVFADGRSISLPDVTGTDSTGAAGLKDKTDSHFSKLVRDAGLLTVFSVGVALTQRNQSLLTSPSIGNTIGQSVGSTLGEIGSQLIGRNMTLQPTGIFRPGGEFRIMVKHDIIFAQKL